MGKIKKGKKDIKNISDEESDINDTLSNCNDNFEANDECKDETYCSEATYLAREMLQKEKLSNKDAMKLYNLSVQLEHTVPPQHKIETRAGSHIPSKEIIEQFEQIVPLKKGAYSVEEDEIIVRNWKRFCVLHDWDETNHKPFLQLRIGSTTYMRHISQRRMFVQFLANNLPNRTLYSVYHRFRNLYIGNIQTRYKPEEDEMIINHLVNNPYLDENRKYADLAKVLRRTRHSIWRRYKILKKKKKNKKA